MTELDVDGIRFTFDDSWSAVKWDDTDAYNLHIGKLQGPGHGTKAVDVIGLCDGSPYLFEVKDFRGAEIAIANLNRDLPLEIGFKARDATAGLVGTMSRGVNGLSPTGLRRSPAIARSSESSPGSPRTPPGPASRRTSEKRGSASERRASRSGSPGCPIAGRSGSRTRSARCRCLV